MAKTAAQLAAEAYEKQKRQNRYGTTSGGAVTKTNPVDASKQAAQSYQQQKNSGIYKTTSGGTVKSPIRSGGSSSGSSTGQRQFYSVHVDSAKNTASLDLCHLYQV